MNKAGLVELLLKDKNAAFESKAEAERALNAVVEAISAGVKKEGLVQLIGFGTFQVKKREARKGRNPRTGEELKIKASKVVSFKAGAALKELAKKAKIKA